MHDKKTTISYKKKSAVCRMCLLRLCMGENSFKKYSVYEKINTCYLQSFIKINTCPRGKITQLLNANIHARIQEFSSGGGGGGYRSD